LVTRSCCSVGPSKKGEEDGSYESGNRNLEANLEGADLKDVNLEEKDLSNANLTRADLFSANLQGAHLWAADGLTQEQIDRSDRG